MIATDPTGAPRVPSGTINEAGDSHVLAPGLRHRSARKSPSGGRFIVSHAGDSALPFIPRKTMVPSPRGTLTAEVMRPRRNSSVEFSVPASAAGFRAASWRGGTLSAGGSSSRAIPPSTTWAYGGESPTARNLPLRLDFSLSAASAVEPERRTRSDGEISSRDNQRNERMPKRRPKSPGSPASRGLMPLASGLIGTGVRWTTASHQAVAVTRPTASTASP